VFEVHLGGRERIKLNTYKDFVAVLVEQGQSANLNSVGLMGDFRTGNMLARDGKTLMTDRNATVRNGRFCEPTSSILFVSLSTRLHLASPKQTSQPVVVSRQRLRTSCLPPKIASTGA
jgi:hypothetical protein